MLTVRKSDKRAHFNHGWLETRHTFSFGEYHDPEHMGFRALRVINEDRVEPGQGFGTHGHRDMEIISYVLGGAISHKDSTGTVATLQTGEVQRMTAGTGVRHSEFNPSGSDALHFLQIWILPEKQGLKPGYEQKAFPLEERKGKLKLLVSHDGQEGSVKVNQDVSLFGSVLGNGETAELTLAAGRHAWVQVARGSVEVNGTVLGAGDGAALSDERLVKLVGRSQPEEAEVLVFDLA